MNPARLSPVNVDGEIENDRDRLALVGPRLEFPLFKRRDDDPLETRMDRLQNADVRGSAVLVDYSFEGGEAPDAFALARFVVRFNPFRDDGSGHSVADAHRRLRRRVDRSLQQVWGSRCVWRGGGFRMRRMRWWRLVTAGRTCHGGDEKEDDDTATHEAANVLRLSRGNPRARVYRAWSTGGAVDVGCSGRVSRA